MRRGFLVLVGALMVTACLARAPVVALAHNPQIEYAFLKRTIPTLEKNCAVITADRYMANRILCSEYPFWWAHSPVEEVSRHLKDPANLAEWSCRLFYRGITCYQFIQAELENAPPDGVRPECRRIEEHYDLVPLVEKHFESRPYPDFHVPAKSVTIGFYKLIPKRRTQ